MSVLIKGMEMPERCGQCFLRVGNCKQRMYMEHRPKDCPLVEVKKPHWIPVTENCECDLMDNEEVLVFQKDGTLNGQIRHAMFYDFDGKKKFVTWEEGITIYNVLAYMPLPDPYKEVTE